MPFASKPRTPAQDLATMTRKIEKVRKPTVAIAIAQASHKRALQYIITDQLLYGHWLAVTLVALSKAGQLVTDKLQQVVPGAPDFVA